jgi:chemotaxis protein methyltransferase CheR
LSLVLEDVKQERFADALKLIGLLPEESHEDTDALLLRAVLLTNLGRLSESEEVCLRLLALDEQNAGAHYLMALCSEHGGVIEVKGKGEMSTWFLNNGSLN